ncbi:MAG: hypothetical protein Q8L26_04065 [Candidatus Omnitrophota bacterium]|nr:hypothetical protein [Candidatus Omnitrophota bacterium]
MAKNRFHFLRSLVLFLSAVALCILLFFLLTRFLTASSYFDIKKIMIKGGIKIDPLRYLLGENLLSIDLKSVEKKVFFDYPALERVEISRVLPDTLIIGIKARIPVAKLRLRKPYFIDLGGAVLDLPFEETGAGFPEIVGLEHKFLNPQGIKKEYLNIALTLITEYSKIDFSKDYPIKDINLSDLSQVFFTIGLNSHKVASTDKDTGIIKVIIGKDDIVKKIKTLAVLLSKIKSNLGSVKYIDLRFKDPVTGI